MKLVKSTRYKLRTTKVPNTLVEYQNDISSVQINIIWNLLYKLGFYTKLHNEVKAEYTKVLLQKKHMQRVTLTTLHQVVTILKDLSNGFIAVKQHKNCNNIEFLLDAKAVHYFLKNNNYTVVDSKILQLRSKYAKRIYMYFTCRNLANSKNGQVIKIDKLKHKIGINKNKYIRNCSLYSRVLYTAFNEIKEVANINTDITSVVSKRALYVDALIIYCTKIKKAIKRSIKIMQLLNLNKLSSKELSIFYTNTFKSSYSTLNPAPA